MWHSLGTAALATVVVAISSIAAAQPTTIQFDSRYGNGLANPAVGTTVFHGAPGATGEAAVGAGGTTVFHGTLGATNGLPAATGSSAAAPSLPTGAGR